MYIFPPVQWHIQEQQDILRLQVLQTCQGFRLQSTFLASPKTAVENDQVYLALLKAVVKGEKDVDSNFGIANRLLLYKNRWYIPKKENLNRTIMKAEPDSPFAGHFRTYKTIGRIRATFFWPKMHEHITEYVRTCDSCQRNKLIRHKKFGLLEPIEVPMRP